MNADEVDSANLRREEMARRLRRLARNDLNADYTDSTDLHSQNSDALTWSEGITI